MDSQLTLVDALDPSFSDENIILIFDQNDMKNTTLRVHGTNMPSYFVNTIENTTTVWTENCLLATIMRRTFRPDRIVFPGFRPMYLQRWLKARLLWRFPLEFRDCGRRFQWREDYLGQLLLRELSGNPDDTLAWFSNSGDLGDYVVDAASLAIKPEMVEMRDTIVLSCLLAEHKRRTMAAEQPTTIFDVMAVGMGF